MPRAAILSLLVLMLICGLVFPTTATAHNVSKRDASFVQSNQGAAIGPFLYLGAKHMVTGIHGWFWQNKGHSDVQFHLTVAGFFDSAKMLLTGSPTTSQ
jgi:hypothetical protein